MHHGHIGTPAWSPEDLGSFVDQVRDDRFFAFWMLVATTGLSVDTILNLRRDDVDLQERRIRPRPADIGTGTHRGNRATYGLDPDAFDALHEHVIAWDKERYVLEQDTPMLFVWSNGQGLDRRSARQMLAQHCASAGVPNVPVKEMRLAYVMAALETGIPTKVIRERLGDAVTPRSMKATVPSSRSNGAVTNPTASRSRDAKREPSCPSRSF